MKEDPKETVDRMKRTEWRKKIPEYQEKLKKLNDEYDIILVTEAYDIKEDKVLTRLNIEMKSVYEKWLKDQKKK